VFDSGSCYSHYYDKQYACGVMPLCIKHAQCNIHTKYAFSVHVRRMNAQRNKHVLPSAYLFVRLRNNRKDVDYIFHDLLLDTVQGICFYLYIRTYIRAVYFLKFNSFHRILDKLTIVQLIKKLCNTVAHCYVY
jgi:hypothetical protein